jgi:alpha-galactosidase
MMAAGDELVRLGLNKLCYSFVATDGGWSLADRDAQGRLQPNPTTFPNGFKPVADYLKGLNLGAGIYTASTASQCANGFNGSLYNEVLDAQTFAEWGVTYVKVGVRRARRSHIC